MKERLYHRVLQQVPRLRKIPKIDITISKGKKPVKTTYSASFSGYISNSGYEFP